MNPTTRAVLDRVVEQRALHYFKGRWCFPRKQNTAFIPVHKGIVNHLVAEGYLNPDPHNPWRLVYSGKSV